MWNRLNWLMGIVLVLGISACGGESTYIVQGTVVEVDPPARVVIDHEEVIGLMEPMTMPFAVKDAALIDGVKAGDTVYARLVVGRGGSWLDKLRVTGHTSRPAGTASGPEPLRPGAQLPAIDVPVTGGDVWRLGEGQGASTAVAFLYTRCPMPEFCPAVVARMQGLQSKLKPGERILAVTLDPAHDTLDVLSAFAETSAAKPAIWRFGRLEGDAFKALMSRAAMTVDGAGLEIVHNNRLWILDASGRLVERYDDNHWPIDRVVTQLRTGAPAAPAGSDGTLSALPE